MTSRSVLRVATATLIAAVVGSGAVLPASEVCAAQAQMSFSEDVLPVFKGRCVSCHQPGGEGYERSGLDLTTYQGLMKGTKYGPVVVPGQSFTSDLVVLLDWRASAELRMPHGQKQLSSCDRNAIRDWIQQGAKNN
jgi:mono/diheme cytochrome c family protein